MDSLVLGDATAFTTGAVLGGLLLFLGIALGLVLGRRLMRASSKGLGPEDVLKIVTQFKSVAHGVAEDMSEYREVMDLAQKRLNDLNKNPAGADRTDLQLLAQMAQANELLQRRIADAEATLSQQSERMAAAMSEARTDKLTQLANRRAFEDEFQRRSAEFRRYGTRFLLMLIDIDRFKRLNDTYGHPAGDAVLSQLAAILRQTVRDTDLVARFGGEEFVLLLPAGEMSQVTDSMERIRRAVEEAEFHLEDRTLQVTISCGAAEPLERETADALIKRADTALYAAKEAGRNRCFFHTGHDCVQLTPADSTAAPIAAAADVPLVPPEESFRQVCSDLRRRLEEVTRR
ncbi:MAG: GGDEF domain-containing protein [Planctomycetales bacterium]|nr:GGDEF domain-containing protein [Planctomycetales bacterium]